MFLLASLLAFPMLAQEAEFQKAVNKNKKNDAGNYVADFSKLRLTEAEITSYAKKNGYEVIKFNHGKVKGYGMVLDGIVSVEFRKIASMSGDSDCLSFLSDVMSKQRPEADGRYNAIISTTDFNRVFRDWINRSDTYFLLDSKQYDGYRTSFSFVPSRLEYDAIKAHDGIHAIIDKYHPMNHSIDFMNIVNYYKSNPHSAELVSDEDAEEIVDYIVSYKNFPSEKKLAEEALDVLPKKVVQAERFKNYLFEKVARQKWDPYDYTFTRVDFYNRYHEYPGWSSSQVASEDDKLFQSIENESDIRYYLGLFPNGSHVGEVSGWFSGGSISGWKQYRLDYIRKKMREAEAYLRNIAGVSGEGRYGAYSKYKDLISTSSEADCPDDLRKALVFTEALARDLTDADSQKLFSKFRDYIVLINGYWAANQSMITSESSLVVEDLMESITNPGSPYILSSYGRNIRKCFQNAVNVLENTVIDSGVDAIVYHDFYDAEQVFVKKANNALSRSNSNYRSSQAYSASYDRHEYKDGALVIYLKNGDRYTFRNENGTWHCSDGTGFHPLWVLVTFKGDSGRTALDKMKEFAETKNAEYYLH